MKTFAIIIGLVTGQFAAAYFHATPDWGIAINNIIQQIVAIFTYKFLSE